MGKTYNLRLFTIIVVLLLILLLDLSSIHGWTQSASLQTTQRPPYYSGVPLELLVVAEGFDETPQPQLKFEQPPNASLELVGVSPNVSSNIQIINGRMTQSRSVVFKYHLRFLAKNLGNYQVGPFVVVQNNIRKQVSGARIDVEKIPRATNQHIKLILPPSDLYVGQRIPISLEWWVESSGVENLINQQAQVPLFDRQDDFQFDDEDKQKDNTFSILLNSGQQAFPANVRSDQKQNKTYVVWKVDRVMVPLKPGEFDIEPASVNVDEGLRWQRDLFGRRTATQSRKLRVDDKRLKFTVLPVPMKGRPTSFAGAVGKGVVLEVSADRSVVQVGDPINVTLILKGGAEVENASLPLVADDLPDTDFRIPDGKIAGEYIGDGKRFELVIRVLNDRVREIPPISYSWFDPDLKDFQTTRSRPIALSVKAAQMVSAQDVVRARKVETTLEKKEPDSQQITKETRPAFTLSGADLSINKDIDLLTHSSGQFLGGWLQQGMCYTLAFMFMIIAPLIKRRADVDPAVTRKLKELQLQRESISTATSPGDLSDALRRMVAVADVVSRKEYESVLSECDALEYAPDGVNSKIDSNVRNRALTLADEMLEGIK